MVLCCYHHGAPIRCIGTLGRHLFFYKVSLQQGTVSGKDSFLMHDAMESSSKNNIDGLPHACNGHSWIHWSLCNCCSEVRPVPLESMSPVDSIVLKDQCVSNNIINNKIAIFDLFIHLAQKRAIGIMSNGKYRCCLCQCSTFKPPPHYDDHGDRSMYPVELLLSFSCTSDHSPSFINHWRMCFGIQICFNRASKTHDFFENQFSLNANTRTPFANI